MSFIHQVWTFCAICLNVTRSIISCFLYNLPFFFRWSSHSFGICELLCECRHVYILSDFYIQTKCHAEEEYDSFTNCKFCFLKAIVSSTFLVCIEIWFIPFIPYIFRFSFLFYLHISHMDSCFLFMIAAIQKLCPFSVLHKVFSCWSYL